MLVAQAKNVTIQVIGLLKLKKKYKIKKPPCLEWLFFKIGKRLCSFEYSNFPSNSNNP